MKQELVIRIPTKTLRKGQIDYTFARKLIKYIDGLELKVHERKASCMKKLINYAKQQTEKKLEKIRIKEVPIVLDTPEKKLRMAYRTAFGREPDENAKSLYLPELRNEWLSYTKLKERLMTQPEARKFRKLSKEEKHEKRKKLEDME